MEFFGFGTIRMKVDDGEDMLDTVLLDTQAQESIFGNENLLTDLKDVKIENHETNMKNVIMLDIGAQKSTFGNAELLEGIEDLSETHRHKGIGGGAVIAKKKETLRGFPVIDHSPECDVNILSWLQMVNTRVLVAYHSERDQFKLTINNVNLVFRNCNGLYIHNPNFDASYEQSDTKNTTHASTMEESCQSVK